MKGEIVVVDEGGHCLYVFDEDGSCLRKIGSQGKELGQFQSPNGVSYFNDEEILVSGHGNDRIQLIDIQTGTVVKSFGRRGSGEVEFKGLYDVCLDDEEHIVVIELGGKRIQVMSKGGRIYFYIRRQRPRETQ